MFRRRNSDLNATILFEGEPVSCKEGESVAAALLAAGVSSTRATPKHGSPRLPYCMMGVCFDCLVEIDGVANRQSCLMTVKNGMRVKRQTIVNGSDWT